MILKKINLINFRNYKKINLKLSPNINIIIGDNGEGKTNILESIYMLGITRSYRTTFDADVINLDSEKTIIKGEINDNKIIKDLSLEIDKKIKKVKFNDNIIRKISDYIGSIKLVLSTPDDIDLIKKTPSLRRSYLNIEISQLSKDYIIINNEYNKLLRIRNDYIKQMQYNGLADKNYLNIITSNLIQRAIIIYQKRKEFIDKINNKIDKVYEQIADFKGLKIKYIPNVYFDNYSEDEIKKRLVEVYKNNINKEINLGMTLFGPHRDDFSFLLNNNDLRIYGSQGQQKLAVIALKLSEIEVFKEMGERPIILFDDLFSDLDSKRKNKLIDYVENDLQIIITSNDLKSISKKFKENARVFKVKDNEVKEV